MNWHQISLHNLSVHVVARLTKSKTKPVLIKLTPWFCSVDKETAVDEQVFEDDSAVHWHPEPSLLLLWPLESPDSALCRVRRPFSRRAGKFERIESETAPLWLEGWSWDELSTWNAEWHSACVFYTVAMYWGACYNTPANTRAHPHVPGFEKNTWEVTYTSMCLN